MTSSTTIADYHSNITLSVLFAKEGWQAKTEKKKWEESRPAKKSSPTTHLENLPNSRMLDDGYRCQAVLTLGFWHFFHEATDHISGSRDLC
jgi:hypothetical protein